MTTTASSPAVSASHEDCTPSATAPARSPAPKRRAARPVVPYATTVPIQATIVIRVPPTASAASGIAPRCPTTAVSTRM